MSAVVPRSDATYGLRRYGGAANADVPCVDEARLPRPGGYEQFVALATPLGMDLVQVLYEERRPQERGHHGEFL